MNILFENNEIKKTNQIVLVTAVEYRNLLIFASEFRNPRGIGQKVIDNSIVYFKQETKKYWNFQNYQKTE